MPTVLDPYLENNITLSMMEIMVGDEADMEAAKAAFEAPPRIFTANFSAAVQARLAGRMRPEVFIELPEDPVALRRSELDALVRPWQMGSCARIRARTSYWIRCEGSVAASRHVRRGFPGSAATASR